MANILDMIVEPSIARNPDDTEVADWGASYFELDFTLGDAV